MKNTVYKISYLLCTCLSLFLILFYAIMSTIRYYNNPEIYQTIAKYVSVGLDVYTLLLFFNINDYLKSIYDKCLKYDKEEKFKNQFISIANILMLVGLIGFSKFIFTKSLFLNSIDLGAYVFVSMVITVLDTIKGNM